MRQTGDVRFQAPHGQYVLSVDYSPDGKQIAAGSSDKTIQILDAATGRPIGPPLQGPHRRCALGAIFAGWPAASQRLVRQHGPSVGPRDDVRRCRSSRATAGGSGLRSFRPTRIGSLRQVRMARRLCGQKQGAATDRTGLPRLPAYAQLTAFTGHNGAVYSAAFHPMASSSPRVATTSS